MKVFVGMSGGVDSSLSAALLVEQGYDVTGVYMKNWTQDLPGMRCPWADDLADAKRVAVQLNIPFEVYDFETEYRHKVVDYMISEYTAGRTPNPDIMCNQEVKFKLFLQTALESGADMIATGHYARVANGIWNIGYGDTGNNDKNARLFMAEDQKKDQTYFLYRVSQQALERTIFPLGEYTKPQVRKMAEDRGLVTARKKDSQGICFVGSVGIKDFLSQYIETIPGKIVDKDSGEVVGAHEGAIFYTLGQRHGLDVGGGMPYYVVGKDMSKNEVYVSRNLNDESMWKTSLHLTDMHWINQSPRPLEGILVRLRHRGILLSAHLAGDILQLDSPERAVASGQSAVIYRDEEVLGGGIIV